MKSQKYQQKILEIYKNMSPHRIRKTGFIYQKKINNNEKKDEADKNFQKKIFSICKDKNPVAFLLGYSDALEEDLKKYKPDMEFLDSESKNSMLKEESDTSVNIFFNTSSAVDPKIIKEHIVKYKDGEYTADQLVQALEEVIDKSWQETINRNKKNLE